MQPRRRNPELVEQNEEPVLQRDAPRAFAQVPAGRSLERWIEHNHASRRSQPTREFHILHQRNLRETLEPLEDFAADEDGLIAVSVPPQRGRRRPACSSHIRCGWRPSNLPVKTAPDERRIAQRGFNRAQVRIRQFGVGMLGKSRCRRWPAVARRDSSAPRDSERR